MNDSSPGRRRRRRKRRRRRGAAAARSPRGPAPRRAARRSRRARASPSRRRTAAGSAAASSRGTREADRVGRRRSSCHGACAGARRRQIAASFPACVRGPEPSELRASSSDPRGPGYAPRSPHERLGVGAASRPCSSRRRGSSSGIARGCRPLPSAGPSAPRSRARTPRGARPSRCSRRTPGSGPARSALLGVGERGPHVLGDERLDRGPVRDLAFVRSEDGRELVGHLRGRAGEMPVAKRHPLVVGEAGSRTPRRSAARPSRCSACTPGSSRGRSVRLSILCDMGARCPSAATHVASSPAECKALRPDPEGTRLNVPLRSAVRPRVMSYSCSASRRGEAGPSHGGTWIMRPTLVLGFIAAVAAALTHRRLGLGRRLAPPAHLRRDRRANHRQRPGQHPHERGLPVVVQGRERDEGEAAADFSFARVRAPTGDCRHGVGAPAANTSAPGRLLPVDSRAATRSPPRARPRCTHHQHLSAQATTIPRA